MQKLLSALLIAILTIVTLTTGCATGNPNHATVRAPQSFEPITKVKLSSEYIGRQHRILVPKDQRATVLVTKTTDVGREQTWLLIAKPDQEFGFLEIELADEDGTLLAEERLVGNKQTNFALTPWEMKATCSYKTVIGFEGWDITITDQDCRFLKEIARK